MRLHLPNLILIALLSCVSALGVYSADAQSRENKKPLHLGSILDPEDSVRIKSEKKPDVDAVGMFDLDQEYPTLPEVLRWELSLTSKAFKATDTMRTRSDLITAAGKGVEYLCLGDLQRSLRQDEPSQDPECLRILGVLESIDSDNPVALCARYGIQAQACQTAYKNQIVTHEVPRALLAKFAEALGKTYRAGSFEDDLSVKLDLERSRETRKTLKNDIELLKVQLKDPKESAAAVEKRDGLLTQYIQLSCSAYRLVTIPAKVATAYANSRPTPRAKGGKKSGKSLGDLLTKGPFNVPDTAQAKQADQNHYRLLDKECLTALTFAEKHNSALPAIPCRKEGPTAPACIISRRLAPVPASAKKGTITPAGDGIERF